MICLCLCISWLLSKCNLVCTVCLPFIYGVCALHVGYCLCKSWVLPSCQMYIVYLGHYMNVVCTWSCSILCKMFATCKIACICVACVCYVLHVTSCPCTMYVVYACGGVCVHVLASDSSAQASHVQVAIQTLDENDNAPQLAEPYDTFVCDSAAPGQVSCRDRGVGTSGPLAAHAIKAHFLLPADSGHPGFGQR